MVTYSIIDSITGDKFNKGNRSWAMKYNGNTYFHLGYASDANAWNTWAKFDIQGRYCLIFIAPGTYLESMIGSSMRGMGLTGVLATEIAKSKASFLNDKQEKMKILMIDTKDQNEAMMARYQGSLGKIVTRRMLKQLAAENNIQLDVKKATFDQVVTFFKELNNKHAVE